ncbi:MAG: hypothetical protein PHI59_00650 [Candidatus Omnitrophica bacterium]|nr:hypothetical protein [Candidatus Omnitrophota bacterium]
MVTNDSISNIKDCVKSYLVNGVKNKWEFRDMRYGTICELKRIGYSKNDILKSMDRFESIYNAVKCFIGHTAYKYFKRYEDLYKAIAFDKTDLEQEGYITARKVYDKYESKKPDEEIKKLICKSVINRFKGILRDYVERPKDVLTEALASNKVKIIKHNEPQYDNEEEEGATNPIHAIDVLQNGDPRKLTDINFAIEDLQKYLTSDEYGIIYRKVAEDKTFGIIAQEMGKPKTMVYENYIKTVKKIKNYIASEQNEGFGI